MNGAPGIVVANSEIQGFFAALRMTTKNNDNNNCNDTTRHDRLVFLADGGHGGAEEGFEVVGGFGVLGDGGFYGLLGDWARIAEVDQG